MDFSHDAYGSWALVAGAAEGLGAAFSTKLAERGMNLVTVDFNPVSLEETAERLQEKYGIEVRPKVIDLAGPEAWKQCMEEIRGLDCRLLVYVAAYSHVAPFLEYFHSELDRCIKVNAETVINLTHAFSATLKSAGTPGGILLMSSLSGVVATPFVAPYAATKAFNIRLAEALWSELSLSGIRISACTAGIITTQRFRDSGPAEGRLRKMMMSPEAVADYALRKLGTRPVITPGWKNRLSYFFLTRMLPRTLALRIVASSMKKLYPDRNNQ